MLGRIQPGDDSGFACGDHRLHLRRCRDDRVGGQITGTAKVFASARRTIGSSMIAGQGRKRRRGHDVTVSGSVAMETGAAARACRENPNGNVRRGFRAARGQNCVIRRAVISACAVAMLGDQLIAAKSRSLDKPCMLAHDAAFGRHRHAQSLQRHHSAEDGKGRAKAASRRIQTASPHSRRADPVGEHHRFKQRIGGQTVGAVRAGRGAFAAHRQSIERRAAPDVGDDAAHVIMRGRRHRDHRRVRGSMPAAMQAANTVGKCSRKMRADRACGNRGTRRARWRVRHGSRAPLHRAARVRRADDSRHEGAPSRLCRVAPSPRSASVASGAGSRPTSMAVGWNCTNSRSAIERAGARRPWRWPRPRASTGLVVTANSPPDPPVQSTVSRAIAASTAPCGRCSSTPATRAVIVLQQCDRARAFDHLMWVAARDGADQRVHDRLAGEIARNARHARMRMRRFQR